MIRIGSHGGRFGDSSEGKSVNESEDQEAMDLAADWADISQRLRKVLGHQRLRLWI